MTLNPTLLSDEKLHVFIGLAGAVASVSFAAFMWWGTTPWQPIRPLIHPEAQRQTDQTPISKADEELQLSLEADPIITASSGQPIIRRRADARINQTGQQPLPAGSIQKQFRLIGVYGDVALISPRDETDDRLWYLTEGAQIDVFGEIRAIDTRVHPPMVITSKGLIVP